MAQVPLYDGNQVRQSPLAGGFQDAAQYSAGDRQYAQAAEALNTLGAATERIAVREATRTAYDAQSAIQATFLDFQQQYQTQRQGAKAKGLTNDVDKWWAEAATNAGKGLDPMARQLVNRQLTQARAQALAGAGNFENAQLEAATDTSWNASKITDISAAAANPSVQVPGVAPPVAGEYGLRADGRPKGRGFLGAHKRADGSISSEISVGVEINGKSMDIPLMVPTLTASEVKTLLAIPLDDKFNDSLPKSILDKAVAFANKRVADGKSAFADESESPAKPPEMVSGVDLARANLQQKNAAYVLRKGLTDPAVLAALNLKDTTQLHAQVLQGLERNDPDAARAYFTKYKSEIDGTQHAEISLQIDTVGNAAKAQSIGAQLAQQFDYANTGEAQKAIDAMPGSPELKTAIRNELEHRHAVQQSDADKAQAQAVSKVMEQVYSGASMAAVKASPAYQGLRDKGAVLKSMQDKNYSDTLRANANDSRALIKLQRNQAELEITQAGAAFAYSDPTVLAGMPREKIAALLPTIGRHYTEQLLAKKDSFTQSDRKLRDAKMDQDDFNLVADTMGLRPFKATSESAKRDLMVVKARTEQLIDAWQMKNGREMPRQEKRALMQTELATQVTVRGVFYDTDTNVLQVPVGDIKKLVVPDVDRGQIITRLRQVKGDPAYMPSANEIGAYYLNKKQRDAAGLNAN